MTVDHLQLREDIRSGERVREFVVEGRGEDGKWSTLLRGTQIGNRQLVPIPAIKLTDIAAEGGEIRWPAGYSGFLGVQRQSSGAEIGLSQDLITSASVKLFLPIFKMNFPEIVDI